MLTSNDLWFTEISRQGIRDYTEYFILDVSKVPGGKMDEPHAVLAALEVVCSADARPSFMSRDPYVKAVVYRIGENGERERACEALAKLVGDRYIDHCGDLLRDRDERVVMFAIGDPS